LVKTISFATPKSHFATNVLRSPAPEQDGLWKYGCESPIIC